MCVSVAIRPHSPLFPTIQHLITSKRYDSITLKDNTMKKIVTIIDNVYIKPKKKTKVELYTELFSLLDKQIQNMSDKEYQEHKRKRISKWV